MLHTEISRFLSKKSIGLTFFLGAIVINAQEKQEIKGKIINKNGVYVPYASIEFKNKQNTALSDAALTDDNGNFTINLTNGIYQVVIDAINFQQKTYDIEINGSSNLGNITKFLKRYFKVACYSL